MKKFGVGNPLANRIVASIGGVVEDKQEKEVRIFLKETQCQELSAYWSKH